MKSNAGFALPSKWNTLFLLIVAMIISACAKTKAPEQLVFADPRNPIASLIYIAEAKGYFKDENLTVVYSKFTSGRDAINSLLAGESDVAAAGELPFANNIFQGKNLRILSTIHRTNHNEAVVARRDRGINSAADLAGKKIGLATNTGADYMLSVMLAETGITDNSVTRVLLKPEQVPEALRLGNVDAIATWVPYIAEAQSQFAKEATIVIRTPAYTALSLLGTRQEIIVSKREALQRMVNAVVRAEGYVSTHSDEALQIVIDHLDIKDAVVLRHDWHELKFHVRLDNLLLTSLTNEWAWLAKRTQVSSVMPDFHAAFVPEFLESVRPQSVTVTKGSGR